jgi:omega-6 fatty acid desaturase (delta-12 desaturase)
MKKRKVLDLWLRDDDRRQALRRTTAPALAILAVEIAGYVACVALALAPLPYALNLVGGILAGHAVAVIFVVGHDACHGSFTPSARLNRWIGRIVFIPSLHVVSLWVLGHNRIHHVATNLRGRDYVWEPMSQADYAAASPLHRWFYRLYRSRLGSLPYYLIEIWWKKFFLPIAPEARSTWRDHVFDSSFVIAAAALQIWAIVAIAGVWTPGRSPWLALVAAWLVPFVVWNWLMGLIVYSHHTHPLIPWFEREEEWSYLASQVLGTVHVRLPGPWHWVDNNIMEHNAHHALPVIPLYNLEAAQRRIRAAFPDIQYVYLSPSAFCRHADACKLYDFAARRWTDFDGTPTGPVLLVPAEAVEAETVAAIG